MKKIIFFYLWLCSTMVYSQTAESATGNDLQFSVLAAVGRSTFKSNPSSANSFASPEIRLGLSMTKPLSRLISVRTGFLTGVKIKTEAINKPGQNSTLGPPYSDLDELASNRSHFFLEVPLSAQVNLTKKVGLEFGGNYRFFMPNNDNVDALTNRGDAGLIGGASYKITKQLNIGLQYYFGLSKIYTSSGLINSQEFTFDVRNEFALVRIEYLLIREK